MSIDDPQDLFESTLDDYLVGIAEGLRKAQGELAGVVIEGPPGQAAMGYHLPRLDFELKLSFEVRSGGSGAPLRMMARAPSTGGGGFTAEGTGTVRGTFVSVPLAASSPPIVLDLRFVLRSPRDVDVIAVVRDALGAPQADVEVQFNVDRERSAALTAALGAEMQSPLAGTITQPAVVRTDADGLATSALRMAEPEPTGALIAVVVDALGATETAVVRVPDPPPGVLSAIEPDPSRPEPIIAPRADEA